MTLSQKDLNHAARASLRLLKHANNMSDRHGWLVRRGIESVCSFYSVVKNEAETEIRKLLEPHNIADYGHEDLFWLACNIQHLFPSPDLVCDIYLSAFLQPSPESDEKQILGGYILPLSTTKSQQFSSVLFQLAETFPDFLAGYPIQAVACLCKIINHYVDENHPCTGSEAIPAVFTFNGLECNIRTDFSSIWDSNDLHRHGDHLQLIDAFSVYIAKAAQDESDSIPQILETIARNATSACLWRRILLLADGITPIFAAIIPLLHSPGVLASYDTTFAACNLLKKHSSSLSENDRKLIEEAAWSIAESVSAEYKSAAIQTRNRILGCIGPLKVTRNDSRDILDDLTSTNTIPENTPNAPTTEWIATEFSDEEYLEERGVETSSSKARNILALEAPILSFLKRPSNVKLSPQETNAIHPALQALVDGIEAHQLSHGDDELYIHAFSKSVECAERLAIVGDLSSSPDLLELVKSRLLVGSVFISTVPEEQVNIQFNSHLSWNGPNPRISAIDGLLAIAWKYFQSDEEVVDAIHLCSNDSLDAVRFNVARNLHVLWRLKPTIALAILKRFISKDSSSAVLLACATPLRQLAEEDLNLVENLLTKVFANRSVDLENEAVLEHYIRLAAYLNYNFDSHHASGIVEKIISSPVGKEVSIRFLILEAAQIIDLREEKHPQYPAPITKRAWLFLYSLSRNCIEALKDVSPQDEDAVASVIKIVDEIANRIYFASGAFDGQGISLERKRQFYNDSKSAIDLLSAVPVSRVTHHLVQALMTLVDVDPGEIFLTLSGIILNAEEHGYQFDDMAEQKFVPFVESFLSEHAITIRDSPKCRESLASVLGLFIEAGSPRAQRVSYGLHKIYR